MRDAEEKIYRKECATKPKHSLGERTDYLKKSSVNGSLIGRKSSEVSSNSAKLPISQDVKRYQRTISDFGAIGDTLPVLKSDDLFIRDLEKGNLSLNSSGAEDNDLDESGNNVSYQQRRGEYNLPAVSAMYNFDGDEYEDDDYKIESKNVANEQNSRQFTQNKSQTGNNRHFDKEFDTLSWNSSHYSIKTAFDTTTLNTKSK